MDVIGSQNSINGIRDQVGVESKTRFNCFVAVASLELRDFFFVSKQSIGMLEVFEMFPAVERLSHRHGDGVFFFRFWPLPRA